ERLLSDRFLIVEEEVRVLPILCRCHLLNRMRSRRGEERPFVMLVERKIETAEVHFGEILRNDRLDFLVRAATRRTLKVRQFDDLGLPLRISPPNSAAGLNGLAQSLAWIDVEIAAHAD